MAKEKFVRTKPHMNVGTIGHVDHGKTTLQLLSQHTVETSMVIRFLSTTKLITLQKRRNVVSQSTLVTSSISQIRDTMLTSTAQVMLTTLRT